MEQAKAVHWARLTIKVVGTVLFLIGLAGVYDDVRTWMTGLTLVSGWLDGTTVCIVLGLSAVTIGWLPGRWYVGSRNLVRQLMSLPPLPNSLQAATYTALSVLPECPKERRKAYTDILNDLLRNLASVGEPYKQKESDVQQHLAKVAIKTRLLIEPFDEDLARFFHLYANKPELFRFHSDQALFIREAKIKLEQELVRVTHCSDASITPRSPS